MVLKKSIAKEILSLRVTLIKIVVMPLFGCIYNTIWEQICCCLDELSTLIGDVKLKVIVLNKFKR